MGSEAVPSTWSIRLKTLAAALAFAAAGNSARAQGASQVPPRPPAPATAASSPAAAVVVSGVVPDEATRQAIVGRVRELYGERVVDSLTISSSKMATPANWSQQVSKLLSADLTQVSRGQVSVRGTTIDLEGEVSSESQREQLIGRINNGLAAGAYTLRHKLRVNAPVQTVQERIDAALANSVVEFEPGRATLTSRGEAVLDRLVPIVSSLPGRRFEIVGHTDNQGTLAANITLSQARAESVRAYLASRQLPESLFDARGEGPREPVASNDTAQGRARNRRIEFRALVP